MLSSLSVALFVGRVINLMHFYRVLVLQHTFSPCAAVGAVADRRIFHRAAKCLWTFNFSKLGKVGEQRNPLSMKAYNL